MSSLPFRDRSDAGEQLAQVVATELAQQETSLLLKKPIVYGLPRGGLPVAAAVAHRINCPLDLIVAKKITRPDNPELAIGAVTAHGDALWLTQYHQAEQKQKALRQAALDQAREKAKIQWTQLASGRPKLDPHGAIAILVDDGIATGMTMAVAAMSLRNRCNPTCVWDHPLEPLQPKNASENAPESIDRPGSRQPAAIWICAPVAPPGLSQFLSPWCDRLILLATPDPFLSVSRFYQAFPQVEIAEAMTYLEHHQANLSKS